MKNKNKLPELIRKEIKAALKEAGFDVKLTKIELDTLKSFESDLQQIKNFAGEVFKDVLNAQKKFKDQYGTTSAVFDAYMKIIMTMVPTTVTLQNPLILLGAIKQGKFGSEVKLSSEPPKNAAPPPPPPLPPKTSMPPILKTPPKAEPRSSKSSTSQPPDPRRKMTGPPPPPPSR